MKCPDFDEQLRAALELTSAQQSDSLTRHSATCLVCRRTRREIRELLADLAAPVALATPQDELTAKILSACFAQERPASARAESRLRAWWRPLLGAAASLALATSLLLSRGDRSWPETKHGRAPTAEGAHTNEAAQAEDRACGATPCLAGGATRLAIRAAPQRERVHNLEAPLDSLAAWYERLGPEQAELALHLDKLAELHAARGEFVRAEQLCEQSLALKAEKLGRDHPEVARHLGRLQVLLALTTQA